MNYNYSLGIDTSNYTTSAAAVNNNNELLTSERKLLQVADGQVGLRQSEAVFQHIKNLPEIILSTLNGFNRKTPDAVGVSVRPRNMPDSYMPCFLAGKSVAESVAAVCKVPCFHFSHQSGHIAAALLSADRLDLLGRQFIAFHISGGTTEAVMVTYDKEDFFKCDIIGQSLDLNIGQAVDRVGNMMNFPFPSGKHLDEAAQSGKSPLKPVPFIRGCNCSISGLQNQCEQLLKKGTAKNDVARYCIDFITATVDKMTENILKCYGSFPLVYAGGVMSNTIIRKYITEKYNACFAKPEYSSDNATGIAVMANLKKA